MVKKAKRKIKFKKVFKVLLILIIVIFGFKYFLGLTVSNIYIKGNNTITDIDIIKTAKLEDYPKLFKVPNYIIKKRLISRNDIISAKVYKKGRKVYIEIEENIPLFYNSSLSKTIMKDGSLESSKLTSVYLANYIPDTIYDKFVEKMKLINTEILDRICEITYQPNTVDEERFLLSMNDGNYVYLNITTFTKINSYIQMLKQFNSHKGILYLDSGEYFEIKN